MFKEATLDIGPIPGLSDWRQCSSKCFDRSGCMFWQYDTMGCYLFKDFKFIEPASNDSLIGAKDCPGDEIMYQSSYGECVSNIKSRWEISGFCLLLFCQNKRS